MNFLNLNHLYYFWVIATEGTVRKAAQKLHLTQPTLSDQIRTLEARLGQQLFDRKNNRLYLTRIGRKVFEHCTAMFKEGEKLLATLENVDQQRMRLAVGVLPELPKSLVCEILLPLLKEKQNFLSIVEDEYRFLSLQLEKGELDLILTTHPIEKLPKVYKQMQVIFQNYVIVCSKSLKRKKFPAALSEAPYVAYTQQSSIADEIEKYFKKSKLTLSKLCEVDDLNLMKFITMKLNGFCILPESSVETEIKNGDLFIVDEVSHLKTKMMLIYKDVKENEAMSLLLARIMP